MFPLMLALLFHRALPSLLPSPLSRFSRFSLRFLRMMKSNATPTVTKITGEPMEKSFLTSSFFSRGDLIGGMVPAGELRGEISSFLFISMHIKY